MTTSLFLPSTTDRLFVARPPRGTVDHFALIANRSEDA